MKSWAVGLSLAMACAMSSRAAFAESVTLDFKAEPSPGLSSGLRVDFTGHTPNSSDAMGIGAFKWTVTSDTGGSHFAVGSTIWTFCIQASQQISSNPTYTVGTLVDSPKDPIGGTDAGVIDAKAASQIQGIVDRYYGALDFNGSVHTNYSINSNTYTDGEVAAAFQIAIWELEYDGGDGGATYGSASNYFTSGLLRVSSTSSSGSNAISLATYWLNHFIPDNIITSIALESSYKQDQLVGIGNPTGGSSPPVPLPSALGGGVALFASLFAARKMRRKA